MTTSVKKDGNYEPVIAGVLNSDGSTPTMVQADLNLHAIAIGNNTTGSVTASADARRDANSVTTMLAVASDGSGIPVQLAVDSSGNLLVQST